MPLGPYPVWTKKHRMRRGPVAMYCRECRGMEKSLPTHCPGRTLTDAEEQDIEAGLLDFRDGDFRRKEPT